VCSFLLLSSPLPLHFSLFCCCYFSRMFYYFISIVDVRSSAYDFCKTQSV
jgi:hypothetical protein